MPLLSINYGLSDISALYISDDMSVQDFSIGYPYSKDLYAHFYSEQDYYTDIFNHVVEKLKVKKTGLQVIATGFPYVPTIGHEYSSSLTLDKLFKLVEKYQVICADSYTIFTQDTFLSLQNLNVLGLGEQEKNYLANLHVYKNAFPTTLSHYNLLFANTWQMVNSINNCCESKKTARVEDCKPLLFFGDIFTVDNEEFMKIAYLYMISLIKQPGIFELNFDPKNMFPHYVHAQAFDQKYSQVKDAYPLERVGTLLNSPGNTSCLLETELGTSQLIELAAGKMFFVPMSAKDSARILVKNEVLGTIEKKISGGNVGFILDTRAKNSIENYSYTDLQQDININLKYINEVINKI